MSWRPILEGDDRASALRTIAAIARELENPPPTRWNRAALTDGLPGVALFFAYLDRVEEGQGHAETAVRLLEEAVGESERIADSPALFEGITGLCFTLEHLSAIVGSEHAATIDEFEESIRAALSSTPRPTELDLISGLCGLGVLALERARPSRKTLERLLTWLEATAERVPAGTSWRTPARRLHAVMREEFPEGCFQVGVAHGVGGLVVLLAGVHRAGVERARVAELLAGAVPWLFAQELPGEHALFPTAVSELRTRPASRSAWCWGAPGISSALRIAAETLDEAEWRAKAHALARRAAQRPFDETGVKDACFCHGTAGLGHLSNRWHQATGQDSFREEAVSWFRRTLAQRAEGRGVAGYLTHDATLGDDPWCAMPGLLLGAAGIGLALISAVAPIEPAWDRLLLLSLRTPSRDEAG